jgi:transposase
MQEAFSSCFSAHFKRAAFEEIRRARFILLSCAVRRTDTRAVPDLTESKGIPDQSAGWSGGQHRMTRPLSDDLRERVVAAVLGGESRRSAAKRFGISVSAAVKLLQRHRATGSVAPGKMGGHRKRVLEPHRAFIEARLRETPHLTLHGLKDELAARGVKVSHNAVWMFLRREGLSFKKNAVRP